MDDYFRKSQKKRNKSETSLGSTQCNKTEGMALKDLRSFLRPWELLFYAVSQQGNQRCEQMPHDEKEQCARDETCTQDNQT